MTAIQVLAQVKSLPSISPAALQLTSLLGSPDTDNEQVVLIIRQDTVLTAKLLKACNSPALGLAASVGSVDQAVLMLGHRQISQMVAAMEFRDSLATALEAYSLGVNALWRHSLLAAASAEAAAKHYLSVRLDSAVAFTIGLLHDIGKLITDQFLTREALVEIRQHIRDGASRLQAENRVLGTNHAEVGATLLDNWRLPSAIVKGVAGHHEPALKENPCWPAVAYLANTTAHKAMEQQAGLRVSYSDFDKEVLACLGLAPETMQALISSGIEGSEHAAKVVSGG